MSRQSMPRVLVCGVLAGLVAGGVVAAWFLAVDLLTATALTTPARLAALWLGEPFDGPTTSFVVIYTVLHFTAFAMIGAGAAWALAASGTGPTLLAGTALSIVVLNAVYYGGRLAHGADLLNALPWQHVLGANIAGGVALMWYLHRAFRATNPLGFGFLTRYPVLVDGLVTGLVGAVGVAVWFLIVDLATAIPFYTPAALGSAVFLGATDAAGVHVNVATVGAYSVMHGLAFWGVGTVFVLVAKQVERSPSWWLMALLAFMLLEALFVGVVGSFAAWILGAVGWWEVGVGNLIAVLAMGTLVWRTHPVLRARLREPALETRL